MPPVPNRQGDATTLKSKRVKFACIRCQKRKIKCNGLHPCSNCITVEYPCEFAQKEIFKLYSSTQQDPSLTPTSQGTNNSDKSQSSSSAFHNSHSHTQSSERINFLENRIKRLERELADKNKKDIVNTLYDIDSEKVFTNNRYSIDGGTFGILARYHSILPTSFAAQLFESLSPEDKQDLSIPRCQFYAWNLSGGHYLKQQTLPPFIVFIDPFRDKILLDSLIEFFFHNINPLFTTIHERVFREQLNSFLQNHWKSANNDASSRLFMSLLYLILAISIRFSERHPAFKDRVLPDNLEQNLFQHAYDVVSKLSFEWQSFELAQAWILITFYLRTTHRQFASYNSLGNALRMCKSLALHLGVLVETFNPSYDVLKAKRIFWLVYTWDKIFSFQCGKDLEIFDFTVSTKLPDLDAPDAITDDWLQHPSFAMAHLAKIISRIQLQRMLNGDHLDVDFLTKIEEDLQKWKAWCDDTFSPSNNISRKYDKLVIDQVYLTYYDVKLSLYSKALFGFFEDGSELRDVTLNSEHNVELLKQVCVESLKTLVAINERGELIIPWPLNLCNLFLICNTHIIIMNVGIKNTNSAQDLNQALSLLYVMEDSKCVKMARECIWCVKMLNHISTVKFAKQLNQLQNIGIDHGSDVVNLKTLQVFTKGADTKPQNVDISNYDNPKNPQRSQLSVPVWSSNNNSNNPFQIPTPSGFHSPNNFVNFQVGNNNPLPYQVDPMQNVLNFDSGQDVNGLHSIEDTFNNLQWFDQFIGRMA